MANVFRPSKPISRVPGLSESQIRAVAKSLCSQLVDSLPTGKWYPLDMATLLKDYYDKLKQDDLNPSTVAKYRQILVSYSNWLSGSEPNTANAKEFIAHLRDRGYRPKSLLVYYHALRPFFEFIGERLKIKLQKPEVLPPYYDRGDFEALVRQAEIGLYHETRAQKQRGE